MKRKSVNKVEKRTEVVGFRLTRDEIERLQSLASRYDMSYQSFLRELARFLIGDKVKEGSDFAKEIGKILAQKQEEFSIFNQIIADTSARLTSGVNQRSLFIGKVKSARKYKKQKQT